MKRPTVKRGLVVLLALGLLCMVSGEQRATADDQGIGSSEPLVIAAQQGAPQAFVPNLIGKNKAETQKALAKAGLNLGEVTFTTTGKGKPGTVVKQKPKPKAKVDKGSAVDVMVLKAVAKISPKIVQKGEKVFMEFPETVKDVTIFDAQGNKLQQFNKGKRFDVTESVIATEAGNIKVAFTPPEKLYWLPPVDIEQTKDFDSSQYVNEDFLDYIKGKTKLTAVVGKEAVERVGDNIEDGEPSNDDIIGATPLSGPGLHHGNVGGNDPCDYVKFTINYNPTIVRIQVFSELL